MTAEQEIVSLLRRYVRTQVGPATGDTRQILTQVLSPAYLARVEADTDDGGTDPLFGVQDMPEEWADRIAVIVQNETGDTASAVALLGPPPEEPRGYRVVAVRDRHMRWRIDNVMDRE